MLHCVYVLNDRYLKDTHSCLTYPIVVPGGDCTSTCCRQQNPHQVLLHLSGLTMWMTSLFWLSTMAMSNGREGPQYWRRQQLESAGEGKAHSMLMINHSYVGDLTFSSKVDLLAECVLDLVFVGCLPTS